MIKNKNKNNEPDIVTMDTMNGIQKDFITFSVLVIRN